MPQVPVALPFQPAPMVWAQSSISRMPNSAHTAVSASISQMCPRMCDSSSVLAPLAWALRRKSSRSINRSSVTSTSTGTAPAWAMAPGTGASVKQLLRTLSPGRTPLQRSAANMVEPQEFIATQ